MALNLIVPSPNSSSHMIKSKNHSWKAPSVAFNEEQITPKD
jgi:hypothetical protein